MLKLKLQYFGHLMRRAESFAKTPMLGKIEGRRGRQRMRWLDGITYSMDMGLDPSRVERRLKAEGASPGPSPTISIFEIEWHKVCRPQPGNN